MDDDRVVDSRAADDGLSVRRRRECVGCGRRFTTFERVAEDARVTVIKRKGSKEYFDRDKLFAGIRAALKNRPFDEKAILSIVIDVEEEVRSIGDEITSEEIGLVVLKRLFDLDEVGYMRFASVYKGFERLQDFEKEARFISPRVLEKLEDSGSGA